MATRVRLAPLSERREDASLFVAPEGYERALWAALQGLQQLILAARGAGKTSALNRLAFELRDRDLARVVFVSLAAVDSVDGALQLLLGAAAEALGEELAWAPPPPRPNESERDRNVRSALAQLAKLERCTFLIDDAQAEHVAFALFGTYRDRIWETGHQWILAARPSDRRWLLRPPADAFWEEVVQLQYTPAQARALIERRLEGDAPWIEPLVEAVGTNPRRLLGAAQATTRAEGPAAVLLEWQNWRAALANLDPREATLMEELSGREPVSASDPEFLSSLGWARASLLRTLDSLEARGLVESWAEPDGTGRPPRLFAALEPGRARRA
jgi:hypothetical protein